MKGESTYRRMPVALQNVMCSVYGFRERKVRMSPFFWDRYRSLIDSESASTSEISAYQDAQVARLVMHAYGTVPYYRRIMDGLGLKPRDVACRGDLKKLPILRKQDVIENFDELVSTVDLGSDLRPGVTSGTTGTPLRFLTTSDAVAFQWAVWWRHRYRFGIRPQELHLNFTGKRVVPIDQSSPPYWRWNWPMRQALVNMQHVTEGKIEALAAFAGSHAFKFYSGYPSIVAAFCDLVDTRSIQLNRTPKVIFLGAENCQEFQNAIISKVTGAIVTDQYGVSEGCGNASRCEFGVYHEDWEFCTLESAAREADSSEYSGPILATGFSNYAFPLIRYEIGDSATWSGGSYRCACGRNSRVISRIDGRIEDYVVTPEGARIMRFDYLFKDASGVREAQVVQHELGSVTIRMVVGPEYGPSTENHLRAGVAEWISPSLEVEIAVVDSIPRNANGKFRPVVSDLTKRESQQTRGG